MVNRRDGLSYVDFVDGLKSLRENFVESFIDEKELREGLAALGLTATEIDEEVRQRNEEKANQK